MRLPLPSILLLFLVSCTTIQPANGGATAKAEQKFYDQEDNDQSPPPRFPDYHALLDWYYAESAAGRKPSIDVVKDEIRRTMKYRLAQPQVYYEGTGYIPGVDEGWRPDVDSGTYRDYRMEREEAVRKMKLMTQQDQKDEGQEQQKDKRDDIDGEE